MKVAIVAANNLEVSPYVKFYTNILDDLEIEYDILLPNRSNYQYTSDSIKTFPWHNNKNNLLNYIIYSNKIKKYCKRKYDFLILLTSNLFTVSANWLNKYFHHKYIVDIRDYTHENNKLFYHFEKKAIKNSLLRIISSSGFSNFLPSNSYLISHNNNWPIKYNEHINVVKNKIPIKIGYVGAIAYREECLKFINLVKEDSRFEFHFYGSGIDEEYLKLYVSTNKINNVIFHGRYLSHEKESIIQKIDILFNVYGYGRPLVDYAISNKFYDAIYFCKPILCSPNTTMSKITGILSYNIDFDVMNDLDSLIEWYEGLDYESLYDFCKNEYSKVIKDQSQTINIIKRHITNFIRKDDF